MAGEVDWLQQWFARFSAHWQLQLRRNARIGLRVQAGMVHLRMPHGVDFAQVQAFLTEHESWLRAALAKQNTVPKADAEFTALDGSGALLVFGQKLPVRLGNGFSLQADAIEIPSSLPTLRAKQRLVQYRHWLAGQLRKAIARQLPACCAALDLPTPPVTIKAMRSRWGSMSSSGSMSFNFALVFAPHSTVDYVLVHELAHLHEPNHSKDFWRHVARAFPAFQHERARLKREGDRWLALQDALLR